MDPQRGLRYYASISKMLCLFIASVGFVFAGRPMLATGASALMAWLDIGFFGLCALVGLVWLLFAMVFHKAILAIDGAGISYSQPLMPWRRAFVPWSDIARIGIREQRFARRKQSSFAVRVRNSEGYLSPKARRFTQAWDPALLDVAILVPFGWLFLWPTRKRQAHMLERIKTTFAPEIAQYHIAVSLEEPL